MARTITGTVVSDKADKTIVLQTTVRKTHPIYKKQYLRTTKFIAHDPKNQARIGDLVRIVETRPISKRKTFKLDKILTKTEIAADQTVEAITAKDEGSEAKIQQQKAEEAAAKKAEAEQEAEETKDQEAK